MLYRGIQEILYIKEKGAGIRGYVKSYTERRDYAQRGTENLG